MYLSKIRINNIRSISQVEWKVSESEADGWHVVIGDNGSGKSSFLRSVALALIGPKDAASLRLPWEDWLRKDQDTGSIEPRDRLGQGVRSIRRQRPAASTHRSTFGVEFVR